MHMFLALFIGTEMTLSEMGDTFFSSHQLLLSTGEDLRTSFMRCLGHNVPIIV